MGASSKSRITRSKLLSLLLRHAPEKAGLTLDEQGWIDIDTLLAGIATITAPMSRKELENIVNTNDKKRFSLSSDGSKIRAAQGHSVNIDLALTPTTPPQNLFHGTATRFLPSILSQGLKAQSRQHVHLSADMAIATTVGDRHGKPVVLMIASKQMQDDGILFFQSENGVWLTDYVAPKYLSIYESH